MPPKKQRWSQNSATKEPCCICCQPIVIGKDEALFCVGKCQQWLHRYCASVSVKCYKAIIDDNHSYLCPCCYRESQEERITELTSTVETMKLEIAQLKKELATALGTATTQPQRSYANVASRKTGAGANKAHNYRKPLGGEHGAGSDAGSTALGEPSVSTNKIKVVGARRIWGTLKSSSTKIVKSVILRVSKIEGELRIKRKDKENPTTGRPKWWYVVHGSESTLMELEAKWDQVKVQTSWKLEPCFLTESQNISPPSATTTDAASTLLPTHIQPSTDVQPLPPPPQHPVAADMQPLPSSSQSPVLIECTQSEELNIQGNGHAPLKPVTSGFNLQQGAQKEQQ